MARIYAAIENFEMNLKSCSCLNLGVFERKRDDTKEVGGGGKFMAGAGVGNSGVQSACKELFRFNERRKIWLNCEQLCFAFCVHSGGRERRMEAEARGDTGFERDDNETFRGDVRVEFVWAMVSRLLLADFCWKRVDLGDRDSEIS